MIETRRYLYAALQHFGLAAATLVVPRIVATSAGESPANVESYCQIAMLALGIASLLQSFGRYGIGSGFLLPAAFSGIYLAPAIAVAKSDGLAAVAGLTVVVGVTEMVLSFLLRFLRVYLPLDVVGIAVLMIGLGWGSLGLKLMAGVSEGQVAANYEWVAACFSLFLMVVISVWGSDRWRPLAVLVGLCVGCGASFALFIVLGIEGLAIPELRLATPFLPLFNVEFSTPYLTAFAIGAVASFLRVAGDVVASHQVSDRNWKRPGRASVTAGAFAEGLANVFSGMLGSMPTNTNSGSVGLVSAGGIASAKVARIVGFMWIFVAFLPVGPPLLLLIPASVQGAAILFTGGFVIRSGIVMIASRPVGNRRAITIGFALIVGLGFEEMLRLLSLSSEWRVIFSSSLLISVAVAIVLNGLSRIGLKKTVSFQWDGSDAKQLLAWVQENCRLWDVRVDFALKVSRLVEEFSVLSPSVGKGPFEIILSYSEEALNIVFLWEGAALVTPVALKGNPAITSGFVTSDLVGEDPKLAFTLATTVFWHLVGTFRTGVGVDGRQNLAVTLDDY